MHHSISLTHSSNPFGTYKPSAATTKRRVTKCLCPHSLSSQVDLSADPPVAPAAPAIPAPPPPPARPPSPPTSSGNLNASLLNSLYGSQPSQQRTVRQSRSRSRSPRSPSPTRRLSRTEKRKRLSKRPERVAPSIELPSVPPTSDSAIASESPSVIVGTNMTMEKEYFRLTSVGVRMRC